LLLLLKNAFKLKSNADFLLGNILHNMMLVCDWGTLDTLYAEIQNKLRLKQEVTEPFGFQGISDSESDLLLCAQIFANDHFPYKQTIFTPDSKKTAGSKIRVGYLCGEFRDQATSILMGGVYESHHRDEFEIYAFDNGWDDGSNLRQRILPCFKEIINITRLSDLEAAQSIKQLGIDILINLNGYFGKGRQGIFAHRPAPIQVNYLGFPGTIGAPYMDYLIADEVVIPPSSQAFYTEKIVYLPNCYQANDSQRVIADTVFTKLEMGLPKDSFVFACFNNNYKITPPIFDAWMRILKQVEQSVLWLLEDNPTAADNLRKEAGLRGVSPDRLIFAKRLPLAEHLARHRLADLFLDTLPYNAHTTASDALWAGLPVLTQIGKTFPGRVAASLLTAVGLPELITHTPEEYEALAIDLAQHPEKLQQIKQKLAENRLVKPLFDTSLFTQHLEKAYKTMYERHLKGLGPDVFKILN